MKLLGTTLALTFLGLTALSSLRGEADAQRSDADPLAVVVSSSTPLDSLSTAELRRVFLGQTVTKGNTKLIPLNHPIRTAPRTRFDQMVLRMSPDEVGRYWVAERIRGARSAPKSVNSLALLLQVVAKIPGAISYAPLSEVGPGLKVIRIDGKLPGDPDYPLP